MERLLIYFTCENSTQRVDYDPIQQKKYHSPNAPNFVFHRFDEIWQSLLDLGPWISCLR